MDTRQVIARGGLGAADYLNTSDYLVCQILRREADAMFASRPDTRAAGERLSSQSYP